ncbi:PIG-L deacetylase family protein [Sunxiuqinia sp. sy24]|uniref:PIG-L deacetylase family protein n=1 Tax=Sunxiuqinia sp. sy24 TaxID=3461495 RepID=UPI004045D538
MKKLTIFILYVFLLPLFASSQEKIKLVVIGAHPDDCDIDAGGTAIQFARMGHQVLFVSLTNGDAGHYEKGGGALAKIRRAEAKEAGKRLGVEYLVLDNHDGELMPSLENRLELIRIIRKWQADIVIGHRPNDYHPDHRYTAQLLQDAAFMVVVPNIASDVPALKENPLFLYSHDRFQKPAPLKPDITIDITEVYDDKTYGMAAHESQFFEWLPWLNGTLDQVPQTEEERLKWMHGIRDQEINKEVLASLIKWYGTKKGKGVKKAEVFEICEYGRYPSDDEIKRLFPMLKN